MTNDLRATPILFHDLNDGRGLVPVDAELYSRVMQYCQQELAEVPDLRRYRMAYATVEYGEQGEIVEIHGVTAERLAHDIGIFRTSGPYAKQATVLMHDRWQSFFADNGWSGQDVMIWIDGDEKPEQQCANREGSVKAFNLRPAKRMLVRVK